jgi:hypothetical protein
VARKSRPKFKNKSEMLAFLKEIGKRNEMAVKKLDKALERESALIEALEVRESAVQYRNLKPGY